MIANIFARIRFRKGTDARPWRQLRRVEAGKE